MKKDITRKPSAQRIKSEDIRGNEESSDWVIVRLNAKVKANEVKYSDLLCKIHKFIDDFKPYFEQILPEIPENDQERLNQDISYFLNTQDSLYSAQLFANFKQDTIEAICSKDFTKEAFKTYFLTAISEISSGLGIKEDPHERKRSQQSIETFDNSYLLRREFTPVRYSKRSPSPYITQHNTQKENTELRLLLNETSKQRDILKAWKENMIKNPNLEIIAQKIIKELREDVELLTIKNTCLHSKLAYLVNSVSKFLNVSSRFQKPVREKEGYLSINNYETEKHKLEVKLREILENNENFALSASNFTQPSVKHLETEKCLLRSEDIHRHDTRKLQSESNLFNTDKVSKNLINELNKQHAEKIEGFKILVAKIESENKRIKTKYFALKKELKTLKIPMLETRKMTQTSDPGRRNRKDQHSSFRGFMESYVKGITNSIESQFFEIINKLNSKDDDLRNLRVKFALGLEQNLKSLIAMNERAENEENSVIHEYKSQIENLEYVIVQNRNYSDSVIRELEESINEYENGKKINQRIKKSLEEEIIRLTKSTGRMQELEDAITGMSYLIKNLEKDKEEQARTITYMKQFEVIADQCKYERDSFEQEKTRLSEALVEKSNVILEIEQELRLQAVDANKKIEAIEFEKNSLKADLAKIIERNSNERNIESFQEDKENEIGDANYKKLKEIEERLFKEQSEKKVFEDQYNDLKAKMIEERTEAISDKFMRKLRELEEELVKERHEKRIIEEQYKQLKPKILDDTRKEIIEKSSKKLKELEDQITKEKIERKTIEEQFNELKTRLSVDPVKEDPTSSMEAATLRKQLEAQINSHIIISEQLRSVEKKMTLEKIEKEILALELSKIRENFRNFESILKTKIRLSESTPISRKMLDLSEYKYEI